MLLLLTVGAARADGPLTHIGIPGEAATTARRLAAVDQLAAAAKWSAAVEEYLRLLDEAGDDLVPLNPQHSLQARWLCHQRLAALPPAALRLYREQVDGTVQKWWEQAERSHDVALLRRIVREAFCSRWADRALDFLGDLAFERGDFEEARSWWRLLVPPLPRPGRPPPVREPAPLDLVFPDPQVDIARVHAKVILARLAGGDREGIGEALQAFQAAHGNAAGAFAGQQGSYLKALQQLAAHPELLASPRQHPPWTTFAGSASRQRLLPQAPHGYLAELPPVRLDPPVFGQRKAGPGRVLTASAAARTLAYYPVIAGGQVLVADLTRVTGYDLHTGRLVGRYSLLEDLRKDGQEASLELPTQPGVRYTLSVADNGIVVRLGNQAVQGTRDRDASWGDSFLVCLDLHPSRDRTYHRRWRVRASEHAEDRATIFEGSPVVKDGRLYVARARISGTQVTTAIECYSAATGSRHWHQEVCESRELPDGEPRFHSHLLTLAGPHVAYCSHSGAVVALDALTGRRAWAVRYPSRGIRTRQGSASPRDLAPCLYADGRLFVAPADGDRILCLDALTGRTLWHSQPVEVVHLLGVAGGKLIFTTGLPPRGIQAVETATGKIVSTWLSPEGDVPTFGRGLLAGGKVFWPTFFNGLCLLSQEDGRLDPDSYYFGQYLAKAPLGNLAFGEGCLAIASAEELRIYVPRRRASDRNEVQAPR